jgi:hypothetical protein
MATCSQCGTEILPGSNGCPACGYGARTKIMLSGKLGILSSTIDLEFGKTAGQKVVGDDAKYMEDLQFFLKVRDDQWLIKPHPRQKNPVFLNGSQLMSESVLNDGDKLSLKDKAAFIDVKIIS